VTKDFGMTTDDGVTTGVLKDFGKAVDDGVTTGVFVTRWLEVVDVEGAEGRTCSDGGVDTLRR
jgi:hypothetical protein